MRTKPVTPRSPLATAALIFASLFLALVTLVAALIGFAKWRNAPAVVILAGVATALGTACFLRRSPAALRWLAVAGTTTVATVASFTLTSSYPPSAEELASVTRVVHYGPLRAERSPHSGGFAREKGFLCILPCEERFEQSDSVADVQRTVADIAGRLRDMGFSTEIGRSEGRFLGFEPDPGSTVVIRATRRTINLVVSVAPSDSASVVASHAE